MANPDVPQESAVRLAALLAVEIGKNLGPDHVEVVTRDDAELKVTVLDQRVRSVQVSRTKALGVRTITGAKSGIAWSTNWQPDSIRRVVQASFDAAKYAEEDELGLPAERPEASVTCVDLDLWDDDTAGAEPHTVADRLLDMEHAVLERYPAAKSSDGYSWISSASARALAFSSGFVGSYRKTVNTVALRPLVVDDGAVRNGATWMALTHACDLPADALLAERSVRCALDQIGAKPVPSGNYQVVFRPEAGRRLLTQLANIVSGPAIARGKSPYSGRVGMRVASAIVHIDDNPLLPRGIGSRPYDGEGLRTERTPVIAGGELKNVLCDLRYARMLGRQTTASAKRAISNLPQVSVSNFRLMPGTANVAELDQMAHGLIITELLGFGFNGSTGDFSYGANGFLVADGRVKHPVQGITIAGSFLDFWQHIDMVASDLDQRAHVQCPSFRVSVASISGT